MAPEAYRATYHWTDERELRQALALAPSGAPAVVDVAAGPNAGPGTVLTRQFPGALYTPLDPEAGHLRLLQEALGDRVLPVLGRGSCLPFRTGSRDVVLYHHGIDDVYETEGREGLLRSLAEAWRVLRPEGVVVASHCEFSYDPSTREVSLEQVEAALTARGGRVVLRAAGQRMDWLVVRKPSRGSGCHRSARRGPYGSVGNV